MIAFRTWIGLGVIALATAGCYQPAPAQQTFPSPVEVAGPPGGQMDSQYAQQGYPPAGYAPQGYGDPQTDPNAYGAPLEQGDPNAQGDQDGAPNAGDGQAVADDQGAMADVDDSQIQQTLDGNGTWGNEDGYGQVWYPDATVVGGDFTPYTSCGSWAYTNYGWSFDCGAYAWGWLPFHYGRWGWFGSRWGWQPGHHWTAAAVEWRHGGGYVGWRPLGPENHGGGAMLATHDSQWRFSSETEFGHGLARSHLFNDPAEGLRVTSPSTTAGIRGTTVVRPSAIMRGRVSTATAVGTRGVAPRPATSSTWNRQPFRETPAQSYRQTPAPTPTYREPAQTYRQPAQTYRQPAQMYRQPAQQTYRQPVQTYRQPAQTYRPTTQPSSGSSYHSSGSSSHSSGGGGHHK